MSDLTLIPTNIANDIVNRLNNINSLNTAQERAFLIQEIQANCKPYEEPVKAQKKG